MPSKRERKKSRGLYIDYHMSHDEIATELGVCRRTVISEEKAALRKCKAALKKQGLSFGEFLDSLRVGSHAEMVEHA